MPGKQAVLFIRRRNFAMLISVASVVVWVSFSTVAMSADDKKEKVSGISKEDYEKLFLGEDEMPGMKMTQDTKGMGADEGDKMYAKLGGLHSGLTVWEPKEQGKEANHMDRVVDLRWVFPDAKSAKAYLKDQLEAQSEHMDPVKSPPKIGDESYVYGGILDLHIGDPLRNYIIIFRQDNVIVKFYAAEYNAKGDLRPLTMIPICQKIVDRIKAVEH
jgi:hypothetical protein